MLNFKTIFNLGASNPLVLGMGHPVKDRLGRLMRPAVLRGGSVMALVLVGSGLVGTSFAHPKPVAEALLKITPSRLVAYYNVETKAKTLTMRTEAPDHVYVIFRDADPKKLADTKAKDSGIIFMSKRCTEHTRTHKTPIVFTVKGKVYEHEAAGTSYQVWCTPGNEAERELLTQADYVAGIQASSDLSSAEKTRAIANMQFSKDVPLQ